MDALANLQVQIDMVLGAMLHSGSSQTAQMSSNLGLF